MYQQINKSKCCVVIDDKNKEEPETELLFIFMYGMELIFLPWLDLDILFIHFAEGLIEGTCQASVGNQRNGMVDSTTTNLITIGQFALSMVLRNVHNEIELMFSNHLHDVVFCIWTFIWPEYWSRIYTMSVQEGTRSSAEREPYRMSTWP